MPLFTVYVNTANDILFAIESCFSPVLYTGLDSVNGTTVLGRLVHWKEATE